MCIVKNCNNKEYSLGMCSKHYYMDLREKYKGLELPKNTQCRLDKYTIKKDGCWEWTGFKNKAGYGCINIYQSPRLAHRISYELKFGKIKNGLHCLHKCDNPSCVNPDHLFLGTNDDNVADMMNKDRHVKGSRTGGAKLNRKLVFEIRELLKDGLPHASIAEMYNVGRANIGSISTGRTWSWVKEVN